MFGQKYVTINFERCQNDFEIFWRFGAFNIYKNDTLYKKGKIDDYGFFEVLSPGNYYIIYDNLFGEKITRVFAVDHGDKYRDLEMNLCIDKLQENTKKKMFFESMQTGDTISINFRFTGCYAKGSESITIIKREKYYSLIHNRKKRKLKPSEINYLLDYENELKHLKETNIISTLNAENEIIYKSEKYYYLEPSIYWLGYNSLKRKLKIK